MISDTSSHGYSNPSSTKNAIVSTLSEKWPLSAKEIHSSIINAYNITVSYQAIHKKLIELEKETIIEKNGKNYSLNKIWISNNKEFFKKLTSKYENTVGKYEIDPDFEGTIKLDFPDLTLLPVTIASLIGKKVFIGNGPNILTGFIDHALWPLRFNFMDFETLRRMCVNMDEAYAIIGNNQPFDQWIAKQYLRGGFDKVKLGVNFTGNGDYLIVHGDSIIQITMKEETKKFLDNIYEKIYNLSDLYKYYLKARNKQIPESTEVLITKNPDLASFLRKKMIDIFKEDIKMDNKLQA